VKVPDGYNIEILRFFIDKIGDFNTFEELSINLDWFLTLKSIYLVPQGGTDVSVPGTLKDSHLQGLKMTKLVYNNNNYNYNIGFGISLSSIKRVFGRYYGFDPDYKKDIRKYASVYLQLPMTPEMSTHTKNKLENPSTKFTIYKTGSIAQASPHPEIAKIAYGKFLEVINQNKEALMQT
jgi:hypothetical protein